MKLYETVYLPLRVVSKIKPRLIEKDDETLYLEEGRRNSSFSHLENSWLLGWVFISLTPHNIKKLQTMVQLPTFLLWTAQTLHTNRPQEYKVFISKGLNTMLI